MKSINSKNTAAHIFYFVIISIPINLKSKYIIAKIFVYCSNCKIDFKNSKIGNLAFFFIVVAITEDIAPIYKTFLKKF